MDLPDIIGCFSELDNFPPAVSRKLRKVGLLLVLALRNVGVNKFTNSKVSLHLHLLACQLNKSIFITKLVNGNSCILLESLFFDFPTDSYS